MRSLKRVLMIVGAATLVASAAGAAVTNTHHDLTVYLGTTAAREVCLYCHGVTDTSNVTGYGEIGTLCVSRCHAGNSAGAKFVNNADPIPMRPAVPDDTGALASGSYTASLATLSAGHGFQLNNIRDPRSGGALTNVASSGFPYTTRGANSLIECTSCHNVHDNTATPFLQSNLATGSAGGESFCEECHPERGSNWMTALAVPNGEHPVNGTLTLTTVTRTGNGRHNRYINFDAATYTEVGGRFTDVASPNGASLNANASHYVTGGKLGDFTTAGGGERFGCYTCHATHLDGAAGTNNLVVRATIDAGNTWNPLCVSCHGPATTNANNINEQNPGATAYFHPMGPLSNAGDNTNWSVDVYEYLNSNGTFRFTVNLTNLKGYVGDIGAAQATKVQLGANGRLLCTSCHDVHGGAGLSMALADLDGTVNGTLSVAVCYGCHDGTGLPDKLDNQGRAFGSNEYTANVTEPANAHHRTHTGAMTGGSATDADGQTLTINVPSWSSTTYGAGGWTFGTLANGLGCADCHVFNGTAHNW